MLKLAAMLLTTAALTTGALAETSIDVVNNGDNNNTNIQVLNLQIVQPPAPPVVADPFGPRFYCVTPLGVSPPGPALPPGSPCWVPTQNGPVSGVVVVR